jgi:hypothetical protein
MHLSLPDKVLLLLVSGPCSTLLQRWGENISCGFTRSTIGNGDLTKRNGLEFRQSFWRFHPGERLLVLTVQFSQSTIACVSWGVKENRQRYSGIAEYPIDLYSGIAEYPIDPK